MPTASPPTDAQYQNQLDYLRRLEAAFCGRVDVQQEHVERLRACLDFLKVGADQASEPFGRVKKWWNEALASENGAAFKSYAEYAEQFVPLMQSVSSSISQYLIKHGPREEENENFARIIRIIEAIPVASEKLCCMVKDTIERARRCAKTLSYLEEDKPLSPTAER